MRKKALAALLAAGLTAAAFFLPAEISAWRDGRLLDKIHITRQEEREGFAESVQLTVAEKLLLMRGGSLSSVVLDGGGLYRIAIDPSSGEQASGMAAGELPEADGGGALLEKWKQRLAGVQSELRSLQAAGAMPILWDAGSTVECGGESLVLFVDSDTHVSFQVFYMTLSCAPFSVSVAVDEQTGRILSAALSLAPGTSVNWGYRGSAGFAAAWRDYWGMDSVSSGWNSEYIQAILGNAEDQARVNGDYSAHADIAFSYDGQSLRIPLSCWSLGNQGRAIYWNTEKFLQK